MVDAPLERSVFSYMHGQFIILDEDIDAANAVKQMHAKKAETIIVKQKRDGKFIGIVTDSDILDKIVMKGEDSDQVLLKNIMSSPIITISAKANVRQALEIMRLNSIKRVPVTDNINILGIITQEGLAHAIRTSVLEQTFRNYRLVIRERYKPIWGNLGFILQFSGILFIAPTVLAANIRRDSIIYRNFFRYHIHVCNRFCFKCIWRKNTTKSTTGINTHGFKFCIIKFLWKYTIYVC